MNISRRHFVAFTAGAGALPWATPPVWARTEVEEDELERAGAAPVLDLQPFKNPVIIESIQLLRKGREFLIRVRSKDGAEGLAFDNGRADMLHPILEKAVIPYFIGKDARELEEHLFGVYRFRSNYKLQGLALWCPVAWVEFAILDMLGRMAGKSLGDLLGGVVRRRVPFYIASGRRDTTARQEVEYLQQLIEETGAQAVKYRVGGRMSRNADALPGRTEQLIPLSRKVLGDKVAILADANSSYDEKHAVRVGRMLEEIQAEYFEEPCPFDHLEETRRVADSLEIPVAGGEQESSEWRFQWMIRNRGVDIVQPDLVYYGGLIRSKRVARMAALREMPATAHISGGFGFIYMLHFASCTPNIGAWQEYKKGIETYGELFQPRLQVVDGGLTVPQGPGLGLADPGELLKGAERILG